MSCQNVCKQGRDDIKIVKVNLQSLIPASFSYQFAQGPPRGLRGPRANAKSGAPQNGLCEGGLRARPQEILRFYMF